jgi:hypothetical protein
MQRALLLLALLAAPLAAQERPSTTLVALTPSVAAELARGYTPSHEQLWRVTAWDSTAHEDYTLVTVTAIAYVGEGEPHHMPADVLARIGNAPSIHSHSPGNCQASPRDKEAAALRNAPFDGILCGDHASTWYFAADIIAIDNYRTLTQQP